MFKSMFAVAIAGALLASSATTSFGYWQKSIQDLTGEDTELAKKVAREELYGKPEGSSGGWENPKSGNAGTVTFVKGLTIDGRECRVNSHRISLKRRNSDMNVTVTICKDTDGRWKYWFK